MNLEEIWSGWEITGDIGAGSFGKVYKITRKEFGHTYESALKVITIPGENGVWVSFGEKLDKENTGIYFEKIMEEVEKEFAIMHKLQGNSNIVSYEDHKAVRHADGVGYDIYLRMELLKPLLTYIKENSFARKDVLKLGIDLCKALEACQEYHIIHSDIKPENIFITELGGYKLGDFGIARRMEEVIPVSVPKGTYTYMAPEIYRGEKYDLRADIYSLGIVLYCFLNQNRKPFSLGHYGQDNSIDLDEADKRRFAGKEFPPPCNAVGGMSEIVMKACAFDPKMRYQSPREMREALQKELVIEEQMDEKLETVSILSAGELSAPKGTVGIFKNQNKSLSQPDIEEKAQTEVVGAGEENERAIKEEKGHEKVIDEGKEELAAGVEEQRERGGVAEEGYSNRKTRWVTAGALIIVISVAAFIGSVGGSSEMLETAKGKNVVISDINLGAELEREKMTKAVKLSQVPNVIDLPEDEARDRVEEAGLDVDSVEEKSYNDAVEAGHVVSQSVLGGENVPLKTKIKIVISKGAEPKPEELQETSEPRDSGSRDSDVSYPSQPEVPEESQPDGEQPEEVQPEAPGESAEPQQSEPAADPDEENIEDWDLLN